MEEVTSTPEEALTPKTWVVGAVDFINRIESLEKRVEVLEKQARENTVENTVKRIRQQVGGKL